jgi:putative acyl-CoA dehydrogenase
MALVLQGALLVQNAPAVIADLFCATRLGGQGGRSFGVLPRGADTDAVIRRQRAG